MRGFIFAAALLLVGNAQAADGPALMIGAWSYHADRTADYNESHSMVGLRYKRLSLMRFTNSEYRESYGLGYHHHFTHWRGVAVGAYAGAWTGYSDPVRPIAGLSASVRRGPVSAILTSAVVVNTLHLEFAL